MKPYRNELKYRCDENQLSIIRSRLKNLLDYDVYADEGQYCIRSIYFDNYENRCYYENENGTDPREKFRIRIYNASDNRILLECKRKERDKTLKTSCLLSTKEYNDLLKGGSFSDFSEKPEIFRKFTLLMKTQLFKPVVIVEYDRTPYVYQNGNVRITLDMNIRSSNDIESFFKPNISTRQIMPNGQHLLEVKYDDLIPDFIKDALQIDCLQRESFSKYYLCRKFSNGGRI